VVELVLQIMQIGLIVGSIGVIDGLQKDMAVGIVGENFMVVHWHIVGRAVWVGVDATCLKTRCSWLHRCQYQKWCALLVGSHAPNGFCRWVPLVEPV